MTNYIFYKLYRWAQKNNPEPESTVALTFASINFLYIMGLLNLVDSWVEYNVMEFVYLSPKWQLLPFIIAFAIAHFWLYPALKAEKLIKKYSKESKQSSLKGTFLVWIYITGGFIFIILATLHNGHK